MPIFLWADFCELIVLSCIVSIWLSVLRRQIYILIKFILTCSVFHWMAETSERTTYRALNKMNWKGIAPLKLLRKLGIFHIKFSLQHHMGSIMLKAPIRQSSYSITRTSRGQLLIFPAGARMPNVSFVHFTLRSNSLFILWAFFLIFVLSDSVSL